MANPVPSSGGSGRRPWLARFVVFWVAAGSAAGVLWAVLTPVVERWAESYEETVAGDVTLAVITAVAGAVVAVVGLVRSGPGAMARFARAVVGAGAASLVAWGTGRLLGAPTLVMTAVLLLWPLSIAAVTVSGTLIGTLLARDTY